MPTTKKTTTAQEINLFNLEVSPSLIAQAIYVYQANSHRGVSKVQTRGELSRTTKKVYKQKGTGGARHGSKSAPIYVGGGVVFGPTGLKTPLKSLNQKMKLKALAGILSLYQKESRLQNFDATSLKTQKTKEALKLLPEGISDHSFAIVHFHESDTALKSLGNLKGLDLLAANRLNAFTVAQHAKLLLTPQALEHLTQRLSSVLSIKKAQ